MGGPPDPLLWRTYVRPHALRARGILLPTFSSTPIWQFLDTPLLYGTVLYCTVLYCTVLYCTVLYCTVLYCTVMYCTVLYCTVLYSIDMVLSLP